MPGFNIQAQGCGGGGGGNSRANPNTEVARNHRYLLETIGPLTPFACYAKKCSRPSMEVDKIIMHHGQDEISMAGKQRWNPIEITFYEVVQGISVVAQALHQWAGKQTIDINSSSVGSQSAYKKDCMLAMLDGQGSPIWMYKMLGCWPSKISPCELSYTDTELAEVTVTLEINKAIEVGG